MARLFDRYDRIQIINLESRTDRKREMTRQLMRLGLGQDCRVEFFPACRPSGPAQFPNTGAHGAYMSHLSVLEKGGSVLILEDDCDFLENAIEPIPSADIFYGGVITAADPDNLDNTEIQGAHCMGFSAEAATLAAVYLRRLLDPDFPPDAQASAVPAFNPLIKPPVDGAYVWFRRAHPELEVAFKPIAVQRPSRSDVSPGRFDRSPVLRFAAAMFRQVKRSIGARKG